MEKKLPKDFFWVAQYHHSRLKEPGMKAEKVYQSMM